MLLAAAEAVGPQPVASLLHKRAAAHKNPKVGPAPSSYTAAMCAPKLPRTQDCVGQARSYTEQPCVPQSSHAPKTVSASCALPCMCCVLC
jgi:hypothetical protein